MSASASNTGSSAPIRRGRLLRWLGVLLIVGGLGYGAWCFFGPPREPIYQGMPLSGWVRRHYDRPAWRHADMVVPQVVVPALGSDAANWLIYTGQHGMRPLPLGRPPGIIRKALSKVDGLFGSTLEPDDSYVEAAAALRCLVAVQTLTPQQTSTLISLLGDYDGKVRVAAATALTMIAGNMSRGGGVSFSEDQRVVIIKAWEGLLRPFCPEPENQTDPKAQTDSEVEDEDAADARENDTLENGLVALLAMDQLGFCQKNSGDHRILMGLLPSLIKKSLTVSDVDNPFEADMRKCFSELLRHYAPIDCIPLLISALSEKEGLTRRNAIRMLEVLDRSRLSREQLQALADGSDEQCQKMAREVLEKWETEDAKE